MKTACCSLDFCLLPHVTATRHHVQTFFTSPIISLTVLAITNLLHHRNIMPLVQKSSNLEELRNPVHHGPCDSHELFQWNCNKTAWLIWHPWCHRKQGQTDLLMTTIANSCFIMNLQIMKMQIHYEFALLAMSDFGQLLALAGSRFA